MEKIIRIGVDTSKSVFQLHGVDEAEKPVLRKRLTRDQLLTFFRKLGPTVVGMEACGGSHHWARRLQELGHELRRIAQDRTLPENARLSCEVLGEQLAEVDKRTEAIAARLRAWHQKNECSRRLATIPGIGQRTATALAMKVTDPHVFKSGRHFGSWVGLTPKDHSTAGKTRLGGITRAGDEELRSLLVVGATAVIQQVRKSRGRS